jgi:hypothetical protein
MPYEEPQSRNFSKNAKALAAPRTWDGAETVTNQSEGAYA